jgi:hypothetical protein
MSTCRDLGQAVSLIDLGEITFMFAARDNDLGWLYILRSERLSATTYLRISLDRGRSNNPNNCFVAKVLINDINRG